MLCIIIDEENTKVFDNAQLKMPAERKGLAGKEIILYWVEYARSTGKKSVHVFSPIQTVGIDEEVSLYHLYGVRVIYHKLESHPKDFKCYEGVGIFLDDGSYRKFESFNDLLSFEKKMLEMPLEYSADLGYGKHENIRIGKNVYIHPSAQLLGKVIIGDNCRIEKNTIIENSVINKYSMVKEGSIIKDSHIAANVVMVTDLYLKDKALFQAGIYDIKTEHFYAFDGTI